MKRRILVIALLVLSAVSLNFAQPIDELIDEGNKLLYKADVEFDLTSYIKARGMYERAIASDKEDYLANYFLAYTDYKIAVYYMQKKEKQQFQTALILEAGLASEAELASGRPDPGSPKHEPKVRPADAAGLLRRPGAGRRDVEVAPRFRAGNAVVARVASPAGHTRLPRYLRGKRGVIDRDHGVFVFADSNAHGGGEKPQHVYAARFAAREVWGEAASPRDSVTADLWDDHLEPA